MGLEEPFGARLVPGPAPPSQAIAFPFFMIAPSHRPEVLVAPT